MRFLQSITAQQWTLLVLGITWPGVVKLIKILYTRFAKRRTLSPLIHEWHTYHWSRDDYKPIFRVETWTIKRGFLSPLNITTSDSKRQHLSYRGKIRFEAGHVVIDMRAIKHREESWQAVIHPEPIHGDHGRGLIIRGLLLDQDFDRKIYSAVFIGVTEQLNDEDAKAALKRIAEINERESCLRLLERPVHSD